MMIIAFKFGLKFSETLDNKSIITYLIQNEFTLSTFCWFIGIRFDANSFRWFPAVLRGSELNQAQKEQGHFYLL